MLETINFFVGHWRLFGVHNFTRQGLVERFVNQCAFAGSGIANDGDMLGQSLKAFIVGALVFLDQ